MNWRAYISPALRLKIQLVRRCLIDLALGQTKRFAQKNMAAIPISFEHSLSLTQPILQSSHAENKRHNLALGIRAIEQVVVRPNEVFSFWQIVPEANAENGYKVGRNLIQGRLSEDYGGGLCQLSSILYHLALQAGLPILERFPHSLDIYQEHERFTPLGADATVVWGYKDLRFKNRYSFPLRFTFEMTESRLTCFLRSPEKIKACQIVFQREESPKGREIRVNTIQVLNKTQKLLTTSIYRKP